MKLTKAATKFHSNYLSKVTSAILISIFCFSMQNTYASSGKCETSTAKNYQTINAISVGQGGSNWISFRTESNTSTWQTLYYEADTNIGKAQLALLLSAKVMGLRLHFYCGSSKFIGRIVVVD